MTECCTQFEDIMKTDNYTPIAVESEAEYKSVTDRFPIYNRALEQVRVNLSLVLLKNTVDFKAYL